MDQTQLEEKVRHLEARIIILEHFVAKTATIPKPDPPKPAPKPAPEKKTSWCSIPTPVSSGSSVFGYPTNTTRCECNGRRCYYCT